MRLGRERFLNFNPEVPGTHAVQMTSQGACAHGEELRTGACEQLGPKAVGSSREALIIRTIYRRSRLLHLHCHVQAGDVIEPTHYSKRVGHGVPGIAVWSFIPHSMGWAGNSETRKGLKAAARSICICLVYADVRSRCIMCAKRHETL